MISKAMEKAINDQINKELYSAYLYQAMAAYSQLGNLPGFSHWFSAQAREEAGHAMKFYKYLEEQGNRVKLAAIDAPPSDFKSPVALFEETLKHEKFVTARIHKLMDQAVGEKDYATQILLQWFVTEQVEEEAGAAEVLEKVRRIGRDDRGLYLLDRELGARA